MFDKKNVVDIIEALIEQLKAPRCKVVREGVATMASVINPLAGVIVTTLNAYVDEYNKLKFDGLLKGLATGLNMETQLHNLKSYIMLSPDNAINVANVFNKIINAECPKVCVVYGVILAEKSNKKTSFSHTELIACKALENATDYDLDNFIKIMNECNSQETEGTRIVFPPGFQDRESLISTCEWAVYNRIFITRIFDWGLEEESSISSLETPYYISKNAYTLRYYINLAKMVWKYIE